MGELPGPSIGVGSLVKGWKGRVGKVFPMGKFGLLLKNGLKKGFLGIPCILPFPKGNTLSGELGNPTSGKPTGGGNLFTLPLRNPQGFRKTFPSLWNQKVGQESSREFSLTLPTN